MLQSANTKTIRTIFFILLTALAVAAAWSLPGLGQFRGRITGRLPRAATTGQARVTGVIPGEFDQRNSVLIGWPVLALPPYSDLGAEITRRQQELVCHVVAAISDKVPVVVLVSDAESRQDAIEQIGRVTTALDNIRFVEVEFDTLWVRDYGPMSMVANDGRPTWIDAGYLDIDFVCREPRNDLLPGSLGRLLGVSTVRAPVVLEHGNLLSNGEGLCVGTTKIVENNQARGWTTKDVKGALREYYGAERILLLEPLEGEITGHIDMFATFTSPRTVVVGRCSPQFDPVNAAILDRNAQRLAELPSPRGALRVYRVPMPPRVQRDDGIPCWLTYTNVVYANGVLLVPIYPGVDQSDAWREAMDVYQSLLPDWEIVGVDCLPLLAACGSLHCATMNVVCRGSR